MSHRYLDAAAIGQVLADDQFQVNSVAGAPLGTIWQLPDNEGTIRDLVWLNHQGFVDNDAPGVQLLRGARTERPVGGDGNAPAAGGGDDDLRLRGGIYDATLGMVQFVDRWYDPNTGRFLSPDPTGFAGGLSNLYCYCGNDPLTQTDPTGDQQGYAGSGVVFAAGYNQAPISLTESCPSAGGGPVSPSFASLAETTLPQVPLGADFEQELDARRIRLPRRAFPRRASRRTSRAGSHRRLRAIPCFPARLRRRLTFLLSSTSRIPGNCRPLCRRTALRSARTMGQPTIFT